MTPKSFTDARIKAICEFHGKSFKFVVSRKRARDLMPARRAVAKFLRYEKGMSYAQIGRIMKRQHTTIVHYVQHQCGTS